MSQLQVTGEAKIRDIQGPVVANSGVITALDGAANQYVRGDGTLASFPTTGGGGSSVSYYLNGSVNQGTIGGVVYKELSKDPILGVGTDFTISSNGYVASFITDANDPDSIIVPGGNWNTEIYFSVDSNSNNPYFYVEVYKYDGSTFTLLGSNQTTPEYITAGTTITPYYGAVAIPTTNTAITDRIAIRIYVVPDGRTVTLHTENSHLGQIVTTFSKGMTSLNNLTDQSQYLTTGTSGTNFNIDSSGDTHTFNLPVASAANTGKLSSTDWSTFNNKQNALTNPITGTGASGNVAYFDGTTSITAENSFNYDASTNRLGVNTTVPNATIGANAGTDSGYSLLLKNDNANYNGIGFGTDSTYGNLISTEKLGTAPARNLTLLNQSGYISITEVGNLGVNILSPNTGLDIYNGTSAFLWLHTANSGITGTDGVRLALFSTNAANLRNYEGAFSITAEGDFSIITLGAENLRVNSADGSIYQSKVANAMLKSVSGVITAAVANTDYQSPISLTTSGSSGAATFISNTLNVPNYTLSGLGGVPTSRTLSINGVSYDLSADRSWTITSDITGSGADGRVAYWNGTNSITSEAGFIYDASTNRLGVNTSVPNATIGADSALDSGYGLLIKTGSSNYNGIGIAIDSTYGNTIETAKLGTASARNLTLLNQSGFVSLTESGAFGVGILTPNNGIDIYNSTQSQLWLHNNASGLTSTDGVRLALFNNLSANLRNFDGGLSLTAEGDFQIITIGAENLRVNSANGFVGIGNPATLPSMLTVNGAASVNSSLTINKSSGISTITFPAGTNDPAFIQHEESSANTGIMRFSVGDDNDATDYFVFGNVSSGFVERFRITSSGIVNLGTWQGSAIADAYISSASTWNAKQNQLNGTGFVKASGTTITYDNSTYLTTSAAASTYLALTGGTLTGALGGTSASFSSTLTAGDTTIINVAPILAIQSNTTGNIFLRFRQSADTMASMFYTNATATFTMSNNMGGLRFNTSGTSDAMNITSSGQVAIGATTNLNNFTIKSTSDTITSGGLSFQSRTSISNFIAMGLNSSNDFEIQTWTTPSWLTRLYIKNNGNVGIGVAPTYKLDVSGTDGTYLRVAETNGAAGYGVGVRISAASSEFGMILADGLFSLYDYVAGSRRLNITSGGNVLIGTTSDDARLTVQPSGSGYGQVINHTNAGSQFFISFRYNGSQIGSITGNNSNISVNGTSDYRLKEDLKEINGLEKVLAIKVYDFKWKNSENRMDGVIAHELQEVLPYAVQGEKDGKDMQGVDYSKLVPIMVKAIQELEAKIKQLENK